jgi:CRISPR-associated protein Csx10
MSELVLTLRQPAQIGDRARDDFVLSTMDHIPGSVVRGAFAAAWLARNGISRPGTPGRAEFLRLFEGGVRFGALLPDGAEIQPLSVVGHKYPVREDCQDAEFDRAAGPQPSSCPQCESPLEPVRGLRGEKPRTGRRTSVSIDETGIARDGVLFTRESLSQGQVFRGALAAGDPALLDVLASLGTVRVGGRRTTHGLADVSIRDVPPPAPEQIDDHHLVVRLRSPGIFTDDRGRPSRDPNPSELEDLLGPGTEVADRWTRWHQAGGWHVASGLPKPTELAVAAGSTYVIYSERPVEPSLLAHLGQRGLGLRRHEGFGDLAERPALAWGKRARDGEARRLTRLVDSVIALRGVGLRFPEFGRLLPALLEHADGDPRATAYLGSVAQNPPDPAIGVALRAFLALAPSDTGYVAGELTRL